LKPELLPNRLESPLTMSVSERSDFKIQCVCVKGCRYLCADMPGQRGVSRNRIAETRTNPMSTAHSDPGKFSHGTERPRANRPMKWGKKAGLLPGIHPLLPLNGLARAKRVADEQKRPQNRPNVDRARTYDLSENRVPHQDLPMKSQHTPCQLVDTCSQEQ
jgi:hypothetical protein